MTAHRSNRRQKQAAATRQDILRAARRLFASQGYVATSMSAIAEEAETGVQTIYDSVGPKRAIILALVDVIEEEAGVEEVRRRIAQTRDPHELIALLVGLSRQFMERCGDVFAAMASAAPTEPDVAEAWRQANRHHLGGARYVAQQLANLGALKPGVSVARAGEVIGVLSWGITWQQFIQEHGWSLDECETWLTETLVTLLLRDGT
ncbi:MAG: TetR/AcrR family transcriptional regulator [Chloroflexia bacterium]|jgi:AcrR family transcriptional regulator|nr:TetR/AcrR family transcriptional regulator [Chloroflexia bacterium]